jgi:hypothetical protein
LAAPEPLSGRPNSEIGAKSTAHRYAVPSKVHWTFCRAQNFMPSGLAPHLNLQCLLPSIRRYLGQLHRGAECRGCLLTPILVAAGTWRDRRISGELFLSPRRSWRTLRPPSTFRTSAPSQLAALNDLPKPPPSVQRLARASPSLRGAPDARTATMKFLFSG